MLQIVPTMRRMFRKAACQEQLPVRSFEELFRGYNDAELRLTQLSPHPTGVRLVELTYLAYLATLWESPNIFEFGTSTGRTTVNLCLNLRGSGQVFTLDLDARSKVERAGRLFAEIQRSEVLSYEHGALIDQRSDLQLRVVRLLGNSLEFEFAPYFRTMDLVFIDGGHTLEVVLSDSRNAFQMLRREGGMIVWHDYWSRNCPEVVRAVNELAQTRTIYQIRGTRMAICIDRWRPS